MNAPTSTSIEQQVQDKYVSRLRARLARPSITVEDARDGMLDCYVSTYYTGVKHGLKGILGVDASPDQVAQVTGRMFRDRLDARGESFDAPSIDVLNEVKEEIDKEFHFSELPVEVSATHDQVCSLLLAKADGLIEHHGDRSVVSPPPASARPTTAAPRPTAAPPAVRNRVTPAPAPVVAAPATSAIRPPPAAPAPASAAPAAAGAPPVRRPAVASAPAAAPRRDTAVTASLRQALTSYLDEIRADADHADPQELLVRLDRARTLVQSIADFSR